MADGGTGNDQIYADSHTAHDDTLKGGWGNDRLEAYGGTDHLDGGTGLDMLVGMGGNDTLRGGGDHDYLIGGVGKDDLYGDSGNDVQGGAGQDIYELSQNAFGGDLIEDSDGVIRVNGATVTVGQYDEAKNLWQSGAGGLELRRFKSEDGTRHF